MKPIQDYIPGGDSLTLWFFLFFFACVLSIPTSIAFSSLNAKKTERWQQAKRQQMLCEYSMSADTDRFQRFEQKKMQLTTLNQKISLCTEILSVADISGSKVPEFKQLITERNALRHAINIYENQLTKELLK